MCQTDILLWLTRICICNCQKCFISNNFYKYHVIVYRTILFEKVLSIQGLSDTFIDILKYMTICHELWFQENQLMPKFTSKVLCVNTIMTNLVGIVIALSILRENE